MAQILTGHGVFQAYLHCFRLVNSPEYLNCGALTDDVEYILFGCSHWAGLRNEVAALVGHDLEPEHLKEILCGPKLVVWSSARKRLRRILLDAVEAIMVEKKTAEREQEAAARIPSDLRRRSAMRVGQR